MSAKQHASRRQFLSIAAGTAAGVIGFPYVINSSVLGNDGTVAPSERITMGCIGVGWDERFVLTLETEEIIGDSTVTALLGRACRCPWHL